VETDKVHDLTLPEACLVCGGALQMRPSPGVVWSYCTSCHWLAKSRLYLSPGGLQMEHRPSLA
jgi:hypothetical protein